MSAFLTNIVANVWTSITDLVGVMTAQGNEIMLFPLGFVFAGGIIGLTKKLLGLKRGRR